MGRRCLSHPDSLDIAALFDRRHARQRAESAGAAEFVVAGIGLHLETMTLDRGRATQIVTGRLAAPVLAEPYRAQLLPSSAAG